MLGANSRRRVCCFSITWTSAVCRPRASPGRRTARTKAPAPARGATASRAPGEDRIRPCDSSGWVVAPKATAGGRASPSCSSKDRSFAGRHPWRRPSASSARTSRRPSHTRLVAQRRPGGSPTRTCRGGGRAGRAEGLWRPSSAQ